MTSTRSSPSPSSSIRRPTSFPTAPAPSRGWFVTPKPPEAALQAISFRTERASVSGDKGDKKPDPREKNDEAKPRTNRGG